MPGGKFDSSKTRVQPVFDTLWSRGRDWLPQLLKLPSDGCSEARIAPGDLTIRGKYWEPKEKSLKPPVSLLSWLIRHPDSLIKKPLDSDLRKLLATGDPKTVEQALTALRSENATRAWYIFEGPTCPDVYLESADAFVFIEGKRTEPGPTTKTEWLDGRHQIWRHIDAA